jgi:hypothetical protein
MPGAMNFITGGSPLGSSVFASAANKIVGFQRGAAGVAPKAPDLGSIISTLSSNILNNVQNQVQSVNQNVSNIVNQTLKTFGQDYQNRLKQIDDAKPNRILSNFLKMYQQAIEYIQFLGNRKNIRTLGDNIQSLQRIFAETFEVAKIIRQTIIKIVKQLSNLPTASTGGGGLNLDVKVPGGPLRRSAPKGLNKMLKIAGTGAAIAGAGALGSKVVSGMMDIGDGDVQPVVGGGSEGLSGPILDRFNIILDRFSAAIDSLSKRPASKPSTFGGGGSTASPAAEQKKPGSPGSSGSPVGSAPGVTTTGERGVLDLIASVEQGPEGYDSFNTSAGKTPGKATEKTIGWLSKNARGAIGKYQQMPQYLLERAQRAGFDANTKFTPEVQDAITLNELRKGHSMNEFLSGKITEEQFLQKISPTWRGLPQGQINAAKLGGTAEMTYQDRYAGRNAAHKTYAKTIAELKSIRGGGNKPVATTQITPPSVVAAPTQAATAQQVSQTVAQPPPQQQSQVNILPMNLGSAQPQQSRKSATPSSPPPAMSSGRNLINLSSTNHDNFLTLYSKMVYNIVDG